MEKRLFLFAFCVAFVVLGSAMEYPTYGWNTWKHAENGGAFERVEPNAEFAEGALKFVPDQDIQKSYSLQAYGDVPAKSDEVVSVTFRILASADVSPAATMIFSLDTKNESQEWYKVFKTPLQKALDVIPGIEQTITLEADFKQFEARELGFVCPIVEVNNLTAGYVAVLPIKVSAKKSVYTASEKTQVPGLDGYVIQEDALTQFKWAGAVADDKFERLLNYAALGLNIVDLTPKNKAVAWQWLEGDTVSTVYAGGKWCISVGETPEAQHEALVIIGENLSAAEYGSGVLFRGADGVVHLVEGGMESTGHTLLRAKGTPEIDVRGLYVADDACSLFWIDEAQRELRRAKKVYESNLEYIPPIWGAYNVARKWENAFDLYRQALEEMKRNVMARTEGWGAALVANPLLHDRYGQLIWMAAREYIEESGYFGGVFRKTWFTHLGGAGQVGQTLEFARKCDELAARARRLEKANFKEGIAAGEQFAAGWINGLEHVYPSAGNNRRLSREWTLDVARGEAEDAQLVLTSGDNAVEGLVVSIQAEQKNAPVFSLYRTECVTITPSPMPMLPLCHPGDSKMPDILIPLAEGEAVALEKESNLAIQARIRVAHDAKPGKYTYHVSVKKGDVQIVLPLTVVVHGFDISDRPLPNIAGLRPSTFREWYKDDAQKARRNFALELMDCHLEPLDLYSQTPVVEDQDWAVEHGVRAWNFGGNLNALADPDSTMLEFVKLLGSTDGKTFTVIPAEFSLERRVEAEPLSDVDLVIVPKASVAKYRYLKIHDSEVRGWYNRSNYHFFYVYANSPFGPAVSLTDADGVKKGISDVRFLQPDKNPSVSGVEQFKAISGIAFDNLRDASNCGSVLLEKGEGEVTEVRLFNRLKQANWESMSKFYNAFLEKTDGKAEIYLYGFDEVASYLNGQVISALKNTKLAFPKIRTISTLAHAEANPEIFGLLDIHCPTNVYATPRFNKRTHDRVGTEYWTYIGGGGYYPFGNFERVDQPLVNSRAFLWEPIAFDHIKGFLFWDIHMWRSNNHLIGIDKVDWSKWCTTHGETNGMGALFYPGPNATIYPSRRAHTICDGIEDYAAFKLAKEKIAALGNPAALTTRLAAIRENFSTGMSVFNHDAESVRQNRLDLYGLLDELTE